MLAITDPDDVPTGQMAKLTAPCVVFSEDKHPRRLGLAGRHPARRCVDLVEGVTRQRTAGNLAALQFCGRAGPCAEF